VVRAGKCCWKWIGVDGMERSELPLFAGFTNPSHLSQSRADTVIVTLYCGR
jgi:hypothetical protein